MKKLLLSLIISLISIVSFTQMGRVGGIVLDKKTDEPIVGATVVIMKDSVVLAGKTTNARGMFFFDSITYGEYKVEVTFIGYTKVSSLKNVAKPRNFIGKIYLEENATNLKTHKVEDKLAIAIQKGDTTEFNADAFKTNPDASANDLVEKLPGVTSDNGEVTAQGEKVKKVLVDGKPYFGDNPKTTLSNIPAKMVKSVQVFDDDSDESKATGFKDGETEKTINIITRPEYRNSKFGNVYGGYGTDERYSAGGNYNIYNGSKRISIVGLFNNVNQQNFSSEDLVGVSSSSQGGRGRGRRGGGISSSTGNFLVPQQNGIASTLAGGINFMDTWGKKTDFIGSYFYNNVRNDAFQDRIQNYFTDESQSQIYNEEDSSFSRNANRKLTLQIKHKFNKRDELTLRSNLGMQDNFGESFTNSSTSFGRGGLSRLNRDFTSNLLGYNANSRIFFNHRFEKRGRSAFVMFRHSLNGNDGTSDLFSDEVDFLGATDTTIQQFRLLTKTASYSGKLRYTEPLGKSGGLMFDYELSKTIGKTDNKTFELPSLLSSAVVLAPEFSSEFESDNLTSEYSVGYRFFSKKIFSFVRAKYQVTDLKTSSVYPQSATTDNLFHAFLPFAMMKYTISKSKHFFVMYRRSANNPSVNQLQNYLDNSNPFQLQIGNSNLKQALSNRFMVRYISSNPKKATTFFIMGSYSFDNNYIGSTSDFYSNDTTVRGVNLERGKILSSYDNMDGKQNYNVYMSYAFPISYIRSNLNLSGGFNLNKIPSLVNSKVNLSDAFKYETRATLSSNVSEKVDFTLSANLALNDVRNEDTQDTKYLTQDYKAKVVLTFPHDFIFRTQASYQLNSGFSDELSVNFLMWNFAIAKKIFKSKKGEISINVFDALNQNDQLSVSVNNTFTEQLRSRSLQRYAMLSFRYTFSKFDKPKKDPMDQFYHHRR